MVPWVTLDTHPGVTDLRKTGVAERTALERDPGHHPGGVYGGGTGPALELFSSRASHMVFETILSTRPGVMPLRKAKVDPDPGHHPGGVYGGGRGPALE